MKKVFFLTLMACSFAISAFGVDVKDETELLKAIEDASGETQINLVANIISAQHIVIPEDKDIILNLNSYALSSTYTDGQDGWEENSVIYNKGKLHVISNGKGIIHQTTEGGDAAVFCNESTGDLTIDGGIFLGKHVAIGGYLHFNTPIIWANGGTITINGGTFLRAKGAMYIDEWDTPLLGPADLTINGGIYSDDISGKYDTKKYAIEPITYSNVNVPGYTTSTTVYAIHPKYTEGKSLENADEDSSLKVEESAEVDKEIKANYIMVGSGVTVTINSGKTLSAKNLAFANSNSKIVIKPGATLLSDNDIITVANENIELTMDARGAGGDEAYSVLAIKANNIQAKHPDAKINLKSVCAFDGSKHSWQRFAIPTYLVGEKGVKVSDFANTEDIDVFGWNYSSGSWQQLSGSTELKPFHGYTMTSIAEVSNIDFTFNTELVGNGNPTIDLYNGWNFLANSYSAKMDLKAVLTDFIGGPSSSIDAAVWVQDAPGSSSWTSKAFADIFVNPASLGEINPMQAFLVNRIGEDASFTLDYEKYVWNPLMTKMGKASAPARRAPKMYEDLTYAVIAVEAGGEKEEVSLYLCSDFSNAKDNGFDIPKYVNSGKFNMYVVSPTLGELERVASNDLDNTSITLQTKGATSYKMKFDNVTLEGYQILDTETDVKTDIKAGGEYEFTANANALYEGRFLVIKKSEVPTSIEQTKTYKNNRIYTITGQYVGTNFNALPNGVYVVNGEKVVK